MTNTANETTRFNWARAAGLAYLGVAILAGFAEFSVRTGMVVQGDAAATMSAITADQTTYALAGIADLFVLLLDAFLGLAFWVLLKQVDKNLALLALFLNLLRLPWMGANVVYHFGVLLLVNGALPSFPPEQVQDLIQFLLNLHAYGYTANGIFFGAWCFTIGLLFYRSGFVPKLLGIVMMLALAGYWTDLFVVFLAPELEPMVSPLAVIPAALAEIATCLWLTIMGGRVHRRFISVHARAAVAQVQS
ncbi:DUF4386 domain-containing protein [Devosia sp. BSSL-BM10]|jgi:hypothetical protein|uniref:DUF4386 domain-containing protein n=2 Tax=Devosia TaxID=46913 RepID=A0A942I5U2_9HYPH|nr:DUF4386 domain-containing protein [Devosia litorisediminis]MBS3848482.1 DUF4386 domain-containing protein [Devosia litorisediminis]